MLRFLIKRLLAILPVLLVVAVVVFLILRLTPGDPAAVIAGNSATNADIERIREQLGLNRSLLAQFGIWIGGVLQGDLGYSYYLGKPVTELIAQRVEPTLSLAFGTIVLAVLVAVPLGTLAAWRMGGWLDRLLSGFSVLGFSVPVFVVGYILIYLFAIQLNWLPVQGYRRLFGPASEGVGAWALQLVLPWITLCTIYVALIARVTRASVSEALTEDYIRTARAKGLKEQAVLFGHGLRNALLPVTRQIGLQFSALITLAMITEVIFSWPGIGRWLIDSIYQRNFPAIQGGVLAVSCLVILVNMLTEILHTLFNPLARRF